MKPYLNFRLLIISGFVTAFAPVQAGETYKFDQTHSKIGFEVQHLLGKVRGEFHRFSGTIDLNREAPEQSSVNARIEVSSIDTGIVKRDNHLKSADFFNAQKFPDITFKSRNVKPTGDNSADVAGDFTMHGVTKPIVLHVQLVDPGTGDRSRWKVTTAPLKRSDFGLLFGGTAEAVSGIGQNVSVSMEIESTRAR